MKLPTKKSKIKEENPKLTILFGKPKCGKTTIASALPNSLILDFEDGTDYIECMSVKIATLSDLSDFVKSLKEANKEKGDYVYEYGILDTATKMEDLALKLALLEYKKTPMGKTFNGSDVTTLPNGAGYLWVRKAFISIMNTLRPLFKYVILLGHTKDKNINKDGKELSENTLDLTGKLERIISAEADALGYVYRHKNQTIINFDGGGDFVVEARPLHLRGKEFVIAESNEENEIKFNWDQIFIKSKN